MDKKTSHIMHGVIRGFDVVELYDKTITEVNLKKNLKQYLCNEGETPCNDVLLHNLNITVKKLFLMIMQINLIRTAMYYEIRQYEKKQREQNAKLSETERQDLNCLWSNVRQLSNLKDSYKREYALNQNLIRRCQSYDFSPKTVLPKAISHFCKQKLERCKNGERLLITDYMSITMIKPYWYALQKQGIALVDDMKQHMSIHIAEEFDENKKNERDAYIAFIAESTKGETRYKERRIQEWQEYLKRKEQREHTAKIERQIKQQESYENKLHRHCIEHSKKSNDNRMILNRAYQSENYDIQSKTCRYICTLCKPEQGHAYYAYLSTHGLVRRMNQIDRFFFDEDDVQSALDECRAMPDVKAAEAIIIY